MIETDRLIMRLFKDADAEKVYEACNDINIAKTTLAIPFPYTLEDAKSFIKHTSKAIDDQTAYTFAIALKENINEVVGSISLSVKRPSNKAELGYWVTKKYWNRGIATEAAKAIVEYGFNNLNLNSIYARHMDINPASGKVMQKIGMKHVGIMREHEFKFDKYHDVVYYEILKSDIYK